MFRYAQHHVLACSTAAETLTETLTLIAESILVFSQLLSISFINLTFIVDNVKTRWQLFITLLKAYLIDI